MYLSLVVQVVVSLVVVLIVFVIYRKMIRNQILRSERYYSGFKNLPEEEVTARLRFKYGLKFWFHQNQFIIYLTVFIVTFASMVILEKMVVALNS